MRMCRRIGRGNCFCLEIILTLLVNGHKSSQINPFRPRVRYHYTIHSVIYLECVGGLGNQLFVWCMAHTLSEHFKSEVTILFPQNRKMRKDRPLELSPLSEYCIHGIKLKKSRTIGIITKTIDYVLSKKWVSEEQFKKLIRVWHWNSYQNQLDLNSNKPLLVRGYYQNYDLIIHSNSLLELESYLEKLTKEIPSSYLGIQAVHVRHGDYLSNKDSIGVLSQEYYLKLLKHDLDTYIFSDELNLQIEMEKFPAKTSVISPSEIDAWKALACFTFSSHFVGANSTLSWWGAFLNSRKKATLPWPMYKSKFLQNDFLKIPGIEYDEPIYED